MRRAFLSMVGIIIASLIFLAGVVAGSAGTVRTVWAPTPTPDLGPDIDLSTERRVWVVTLEKPQTIVQLDEMLKKGWGIERVDTLGSDVKVYIMRWPASK